MNDLEALHLAAFSFAVDQVSAEVITAFDAAGIPTVLVKGPAIATWLYADNGSRLYGDTDLLLREADWKRASAALGELGFEDDLGPLAHPRMESIAGHPWYRAGDGAGVDLHLTLFGIGVEPAAVWEAFSTGVEHRVVGGTEVALPPYPARLLHVALHAVQHGGGALSKPMLDLERALEHAPRETWVRACELAERLDAAATFGAGLSLTAAGRRLAAAIGTDIGGSAQASLRLGGVPLAEGFGELAAAPGPRAKLDLLVRELFPNPAFMRWWSPLARRGHLGLVAAYAWRPLWLASHAIPGYRAWRRGRRAAA